MRSWLALAALSTLSLSACASITSAPAGLYAAPAPYNVSLGRQWSDMSAAIPNQAKTVKLLTIDGPLLNRLYIVGGLKPGDVIFKSTAKDKPSPAFHAGMSASERMEFVADNLALAGYQRVETARPRPAKFAEADGVRFDLVAKTAEGLDIRGTAEVSEIAGNFYAIIYMAPAEHYFDANLPEVEKIMGSAHLAAKS